MTENNDIDPRQRLRPNRGDPLHNQQLQRDVQATNEQTARALGPLPPGGLPLQPKRKPDLPKSEPMAQSSSSSLPADTVQDQPHPERTPMGFVNEFIPAEDVEAYGLKAIDQKFIVGGTNARDWTIDRERNMYLRNVAIGGGAEPEIRNQTKWSFFWRGELLTLRLDSITGGGGRGEPGWSHWKLMMVNGSYGLPAHLKKAVDAFIADLKQALTAYQGAGVYSAAYTSYSVILEIDEGCVL